MNTLLIMFILLLLSSQTYISYIYFLLSMILIILMIMSLGNYYIGLIYLMIYIGSIAILFVYILMVLSIISREYLQYSGWILLGTVLLLFYPDHFIIRGLIFDQQIYFNIINLTTSYLFSILLIPISLILFIAMIFAIRSI